MIIAEFCGNHNGDRSLLFNMIAHAAEAGATFCKIQSFFADDLSSEWEHDHTRSKQLELSWEDHRVFVATCENHKITPMTTVYTTKYAQDLWNAGFKWVKIGSPQATNEQLIRTYVELGFQVIVSTGGHKLQSLPRIHPLAGVLHCVSKYPCSPYETNLIRMVEIKKYFPSAPVGFSSHVDPTQRDWAIPLKLASFMGATFIEVHFTLLSREKTKDGNVSLDHDQLSEICQFDRLEPADKRAYMGWFGTLMSGQEQKERDLISKYAKRWK